VSTRGFASSTAALRFSIIFLLAAVLAGFVGCKSPESEKKKELTTLRIHVQASNDGAQSADVVPVFRENPVLVKIERAPFLSEANVASAAVVDDLGGFALRVQFERRGRWLLEQYTTLNKGRHLAIYSQFGTTPNQTRWLAAPRVTQRIADGVLVFTPDATREEADRIVRGLNNLVRENKKKSAFKDLGL
jgi:hypothetical protein